MVGLITVDRALSASAVGSVDNYGHPIEYRIDFGDGESQDWTPAGGSLGNSILSTQHDQTPVDSGFHAVHFIDASIGTVAGLNGTGFGANLGFAVGSGGTVLRTADGGASWSLVPTGTTGTILGVSTIDEQDMTIVGQICSILPTNDGGGG